MKSNQQIRDNTCTTLAPFVLSNTFGLSKSDMKMLKKIEKKTNRTC